MKIPPHSLATLALVASLMTGAAPGALAQAAKPSAAATLSRM